MSHTWQPNDYREHAGFVPALGRPVVELLAPKPGERVLDLGCGDGVLTAQLVAAGASVVGVDASPEMIAAAKARGLDALVMDATALRFDTEFDAVFSNAALHWVLDADAVITGVVRALKPGGRFVGELGGHGNVAAIATALRAVLRARGVEAPMPWFFPTAAEYAQRLAAGGLTVEHIELKPRPTPLPTGMEGWLTTFAEPFVGLLPKADRGPALSQAVELLRPSLCDVSGHWTADYVRLRFASRLATQPISALGGASSATEKVAAESDDTRT